MRSLLLLSQFCATNNVGSPKSLNHRHPEEHITRHLLTHLVLLHHLSSFPPTKVVDPQKKRKYHSQDFRMPLKPQHLSARPRDGTKASKRQSWSLRRTYTKTLLLQSPSNFRSLNIRLKSPCMTSLVATTPQVLAKTLKWPNKKVRKTSCQ